MKLRWLIPIAVLIPLRALAFDGDTHGRIITLTLQPGAITTLHLRPEFESIIHMPEEVTSVVVGSPGSFKAEHSEAEPEYVYVKPLIHTPIQSNLLIATKSGQHVVLELISDGASEGSTQAVDFLIEYHAARSFLVLADPAVLPVHAETSESGSASPTTHTKQSLSAIDEEFEQQKLINAPNWGLIGTVNRSGLRLGTSGNGVIRLRLLIPSITRVISRLRSCRLRSRSRGSRPAKRRRTREVFLPTSLRFATTD